MEQPLLSVCLITYNHAPFIRQAIEGVFMQKIGFEWDLTIADDFSTDGTREILLEYQQKYPDRIRLILQQKNVGALQNWFDLMAKPSGKYIAYFEGDDYWSHPLKLQKQVGFLEANPDFSMCFHRVYELEPGKEAIYSGIGNPDTEETYTIMDLAKYNFIHTPSVVFRRKVSGDFPSWFRLSPVGDYVLHMLNASEGKIKYLPEPMAVYRKHVGTWSGQSQMKMWEKWITVLDLLMTHFRDHEVEKELKAQRDHVITQILTRAKQKEVDYDDLIKSPRTAATMISGKNLLAALKYKIFSKQG